jgi:hypothetical protein
MSEFIPFGVIPNKGGLSVKNYPTPYGVRAYPITDKKGNVTGYGGEMLPKSVGWLGLLEGKGKLKGSAVTEFSSEDEKGNFPLVVPTLDMNERESIAKGIVTPEIYKKAILWRDLMQSQGESAFYNEFPQ